MSAKGKKITRAELKRFFGLFRGYISKYIKAALAVSVFVLVSFVTPLFVGAVIDSIQYVMTGVEPTGTLLKTMGVGYDYFAHNLGRVALMMLVLALVGGACQYLRGKWTAEAGESIAENTRKRLYDHLQRMTYDYHVKAETGDLIQRCTDDVDTIRRFLCTQLLEVVRILIMIVVSLTLMFGLHAKLTLLSLVLMPFLFALGFWFFGWVRRLFADMDEADGKLSAMLQESLTGVRVVRAFGRQKYEQQRFDKRVDDVYDKSIAIANAMAVYWSVSEMLVITQTAITLLFGIWFARRGELSVGEVTVFVSYIGMLLWPIRILGRLLSDFGKALVASSRIGVILDTEAEQDTPDATEAPLDGEIVFDHVSFGYEPDKPILKDVSFAVKPGQTVAILGATGSGKSTMMHLLLRLYEPTSGRITIGGRDIRTIKKTCLREGIGLVLQEPFLYSRTIGENIAIARPDAPQSEINAVTADTVSDGFIKNFETGYETQVGERGVTLSGGQRQRLAIARTLLRNNDVLVLDDSLSAVDTETDRLIREALQRRREERAKKQTTFIISHRITTLADADCILVLEDGRIADSGTHEALISREGLYARVYRIQAALEAELQEEEAI